MKKLSLAYGKRHKEINLSSLGRYEIFSPRNYKPEGGEESIIRKSVDHPIGMPSLLPLLRRKRPKRITVVLSDVTRVTGSAVFLPLLMEIWDEAGIAPESVTYLIAAGIHPPCSREQVESLFGISSSSPLAVNDFKPPYRYILSNGSLVVQHNSRDDKELTEAGKFLDGAVLMINKYAMEADFLLLTGAITTHYLAGFGGGRKAILPGISSYESCLGLHRLSLYARRHRKNTCASLGTLRGNPLHLRIQEAARIVKPDFLLNTLCDEEKKIIHAVSGHWDLAFKEGTRFLRKNFRSGTDALFDAAVVSCGGFPKDINFIQSHKSLDNAVGLVKDDGALLLMADCAEGIGNPTFLNWFRFGSEREFVKALKADFEINGQTALSTFLKCARVRVSMITSLGEDALRKMNIQKVSSVEEFMEKEKLSRKRVALVPYGASIWIGRRE